MVTNLSPAAWAVISGGVLFIGTALQVAVAGMAMRRTDHEFAADLEAFDDLRTEASILDRCRPSWRRELKGLLDDEQLVRYREHRLALWAWTLVVLGVFAATAAVLVG